MVALQAMAAVLVVVLTGPAAGAGRGGSPLDRAFGRDGRVLLPLGSNGYGVTDVAIDRDGRIVLAGMDDIDGDAAFTVARLLPSGGRDRSFGQGGVVKTGFSPDFPDGPTDIPYAVALQRDGRIVVAGVAQGPEQRSVALARYMPGGALDDSFGDGGRVVTDVFCSGNECSLRNAADMVIQADGKIVVTGVAFLDAGQVLGAMRYLPNGQLDQSFGGEGFAVASLGYGNQSAHAVALHGTGLVVAGTTSSEFGVVQLNADGSVDRSFGSDGVTLVEVPPSDYQAPRGIDVDRSDRIVIAGVNQTGHSPSTYDYTVLRFRPNGHLDQTFSGDGVAQLDMSTQLFGGDQAEDVVVQRDGKVVVAGLASKTRLEFGVVRFTERGRLDRRFGRKGKVKIDFGDQRGDWAQAVTLDGSRRIVVAGGSALPTGGAPFYEWAVARIRT